MATQIARIGGTEATDAASLEDGYEEWACAEIRRGISAADAGRTISHEKVVEWLRSLGTEKALPPPSCDE